jgi:outer membrane protein
MKIRIKHATQLLAMAAALAATSGAMAQSKGEYTFKVGVNKITPHVTSGEFDAPTLPGSTTDVGSDTKPIFSGAYMITDNISAELDLGVPYKHKLYGDGMIKGVGELGTVEALPPTLFAQYRFFEPKAMVRPYLGLGLTYAYFQKETGSSTLTAFLNPGGSPATFTMDSKFALSYQLGATVRINDRWFADFAAVKTKLKTTAHFSTNQTISARLDPLALSVGIGYKF